MAEDVQEKNTTPEKTNEDSNEKPLDKMTALELREIAKKIPGVSGVHAMKKDDLLKIVKEHRGIQEEEQKKPKKKTKATPVQFTPKELKDKIALLREEKENARKAEDKKKVEILRLRINRLKKKTRRAAKA